METSQPTPLAASRPASPLSGIIDIPGDKSISHRALMFAALAVGQSRITGLLEGEDVLRTAAAMRALGAEISRDGADWLVAGRGIGGLTAPDDVLDMGNSGTAARLLAGILATHDLYAVMTGDASLRRRPMRRVIDPLVETGAVFTARTGGRLPLCVQGARDALPITYRLPVASAQVKSAILLAGLNARGVTQVEEPEPTRDHSENMLRHFGAQVSVTPAGHGNIIRLTGQPELRAADVMVPGDPSSAAFPIVAALLVAGSEITLRNIGLNPLRTGLLDCLRDMGARLEIQNARSAGGEPVGDIDVRHSALRAIDVPAGMAPRMIDEYPILAVACAGCGALRRREHITARSDASADALHYPPRREAADRRRRARPMGRQGPRGHEGHLRHGRGRGVGTPDDTVPQGGRATECAGGDEDAWTHRRSADIENIILRITKAPHVSRAPNART